MNFRTFLEHNDQEIKNDLLKSIRPFAGTIYHGTPLEGALCIARDGFKTNHHGELDGFFLSASVNQTMINAFGQGTGFQFHVKFTKALELSDYLYAVLTRNTGMDLYGELKNDPTFNAWANKLGLHSRWGGYGIEDGWVFFDKYLPKDVDALIIPGFHSTHERAEAELAITENGTRKLKSFVTKIFINRKSYQPQNGWKILNNMVNKGFNDKECV